MRHRLDTWKAIAAYVGLSIKACQILASRLTPEDDRLPVFKLRVGPFSRVCSFTDEIEEWQRRMRQKTGNVRRFT